MRRGDPWSRTSVHPGTRRHRAACRAGPDGHDPSSREACTGPIHADPSPPTIDLRYQHAIANRRLQTCDCANTRCGQPAIRAGCSTTTGPSTRAHRACSACPAGAAAPQGRWAAQRMLCSSHGRPAPLASRAAAMFEEHEPRASHAAARQVSSRAQFMVMSSMRSVNLQTMSLPRGTQQRTTCSRGPRCIDTGPRRSAAVGSRRSLIPGNIRRRAASAGSHAAATVPRPPALSVSPATARYEHS